MFDVRCLMLFLIIISDEELVLGEVQYPSPHLVSWFHYQTRTETQTTTTTTEQDSSLNTHHTQDSHTYYLL